MNKHRLQFDFSESATKRLDELVDKFQASSRAEVVRKALVLLEHVAKAQADGAEIIIRLDGKEREILFL